MALAANGDLDIIISQASQKLGYSSLRENQHKAVLSFLKGNDVFVILPTGSGKSLCFSVLPFAFDLLYGRVGSIVIVVSPLIALMKDQVTALTSKGVSAAYISSDVDDRVQRDSVLRGKAEIVFIGPEMLMQNTTWREMLRTPVYKSNLVAFVVDEVHCVTKWGDYFRQEFKHLGAVRSLIPSHVHIMAMTATATTATRKNVITTLGLIDPVIISASPDKPNLTYTVRERGSIESVFTPLVSKLRASRCRLPRIIIFCRTCEECSELYRFFYSSLKEELTEPVGAPNLAQFRLVDMYTSVARKSIKDSIVASFGKSNAPLRVVICTIAFGMGIDCVGVRQVIHWGPSLDIESYVQECGRAGRDGLPSNALLLWDKSDFRFQTISEEMELYCRGQYECRRTRLMSYLDCTFENTIVGCNCCDVCATVKCHSTCCNCNSFPI